MAIPNIKTILEKIQNADYAGYFELMDSAEIPKQYRHRYSDLKNIFISGKYPYNFHEQLAVFSRQVVATDIEETYANLGDSAKQGNQNSNKDEILEALEKGDS